MQQATSTTFVIFGITGDLAHRKLIPALFDVIAGRESPVRIVGVSSRPIGDDGVREIISKSLADHGGFAQDVGSTIAEATHCHVPRDAEDLAILEQRLNDVESGQPANRVFYLGVPPDAAAHTATMIGMARLADGGGWGRIVVEKPFGRDGVSAALLNTLLHTHFSEDQIYRMDHYLGKEAVQNLLTFRFANPLFESTWNRDRIESVQIQVTETLGVGSRAGYYDGAGIVRDMVQNHLTQLVALVAMEAPSSFTAEAIRNAKVGVLQSIRTVSASDVTFGQYTAGSINGIAAAGYTDEPGVDSESHTATYIRLKLSIDTWRWQGVPFYLSTGKRLDERVSTIVVTYKPAPVCLFHGRRDDCPIGRNTVTLRIQPDEGFDIGFSVKDPDSPLRVVTQPLSFDYSDAFSDIPDAYRTLVEDILDGDQTLFVRGDEVEESWRIYEDVLDASSRPHPYSAGSRGPRPA